MIVMGRNRGIEFFSLLFRLLFYLLFYFFFSLPFFLLLFFFSSFPLPCPEYERSQIVTKKEQHITVQNVVRVVRNERQKIKFPLFISKKRLFFSLSFSSPILAVIAFDIALVSNKSLKRKRARETTTKCLGYFYLSCFQDHFRLYFLFFILFSNTHSLSLLRVCFC